MFARKGAAVYANAMTLMEIYQDQIATGALLRDDAQMYVLPALDRLYGEILTPQKRGWFQKAPPAPRGVYLWGGVGRGKSMLMDMFARAAKPHVQRVHFHAFMQSVHADMAEARKKGTTDAILPVAQKIAKNTRCLAFDEMQITDITDAMIVGRLFEQLFAAGVAIVATSNRAPDELYKDGLNRALFLPFIAMLHDKMEVLELSSPTDYRQNLLQGTRVYFHPICAENTQHLDQIWQDLAGGQGKPLVLHVNGRDVTITAFRNGVARSSFNALCAAALGPADYLALAQTAKVLILDDIPILGAQNANEAKRFVTLIDTLYEAGTRLIATAMDEPDALYPAGKGSFEFQRTASRLKQMQSANWVGQQAQTL